MALDLSAEGSFEVGATDDSSSNVASTTSTPPTTVADEASLHSESPKRDVVHVAVEPEPEPAHAHEHEHEHPQEPLDAAPEPIDTVPTAVPAEPVKKVTAAKPAPPPSLRSRRSNIGTPVYNLAKLSGTDGHGKRRAKGDIVADRRRRRKTISGPIVSLGGQTTSSPATLDSIRHAPEALSLYQTLKRADAQRTRLQADANADPSPSSRRSLTRRSSAIAPTATPSRTRIILKPRKRNRKDVEQKPAIMSREMKRLADTKEFAGVDTEPVLLSYWSNGKYVDPNAAKQPQRKKSEPEPAEEEEAEPEPVVNAKKRREKKYLDKGLYAGQDAPIDISKGLSVAEKKKLAQLPELIPNGRVNKTMPLPMFNGLRNLINGRDFKLPFNVCNPLPPGQPKPDEWKKMTKSNSPVNLIWILTNTAQIGSSASPRTTGASHHTSTTINPSAYAIPRMVAVRVARTESCCTNATSRTATPARNTAPTAHLQL